ncbi:hypothetical protein [Bosea lathyri]|uniref:hypothetical protein n=1 Tax=Bosea lathyri TaxID=1036778 RepID=UPI000CDED500|nr:hypothetical protein [Bosea lathyri]
MHFGQAVQSGPPRQSVEFTYLIVAATLLPPDKKFRWPGVVMCWAPTPMKTESPDAGVMFSSKAEPIPVLHLSLEVTRPQFSDMLRLLETGRFKEFYFSIEDGADGSWPIRSWGMTTEIRS